MYPAVNNLPSPDSFAKLLRDWLDENIQLVRAERDVVAREDTFALVRDLQRFREVAADYARAFSSAARVAAQELEEELKYAVGEQDGIPTSSMSVPDTDGTKIKISLDAPNRHTIDPEPVYRSVAVKVITESDILERVLTAATDVLINPDGKEEPREDFATTVAGLVVTAMQELAQVGNFEPQVSKVRALATWLSAHGMDDAAGVASKAIRTTKDYNGVKISREVPKA